MVKMRAALANVNTVVYGAPMSDQLSAKDWLDQGLKTLAESGFTALKAEPLAKAMGVSRGSFYWHFADVDAFHAAVLAHWREVAAEQIIAGIEAAVGNEGPIELLLRRTFGRKPALESAIRSWATLSPVARTAVQAIDRRRLSYVESLLEASGIPSDIARPRAQILYWAFLGFALSEKPLPRDRQAAVLEELIRVASR
ncbi:MAG: transcriptional regulator, TetR family [Tardiphaga sp.]|jgi:AcrR family transcriptional regulator|nr:transcriptional regulator, TetR family [Tardiphaga sp.]